MDKIFIEGLQVQSLIGVYDWERTSKTRLIVDLELAVDLQTAAVSDNVEHTVDYGKVAELVEQVAARSEFQLLEALANAILTDIFAHFACQQIRLKLSKPDILDNARNVAIEIHRSR